MGLRDKCLVLFAAVGAASVLLAGSAFAADDKNCDSFNSQAEAQANLRADPSDEDRLDRDNDGVACEEHSPYASSARDEVPVGAQQVTSSTVPAAVATTVTTAAVSVVAQPRTATTLRATVRSTTMANTGPSSTTLIAGVGVLLVAAGLGARRRAGDTRPAGRHFV